LTIKTETSFSWCERINEHASRLQNQWIAMRRYLHQHPELSEQERATTEYLATQLGKLALPVHVVGEGRGLTADLITSPTLADGPRIALRGDIDALPIDDEKDVPYRSCSPGVMHACGHDVHAAIVVGAMQLLVEMDRRGELPWPIAVRALLQPAEEKATGAKYMIQHHAIRDIDAILALHVDPTRSTGVIGLRDGFFTAACDVFEISIHGQGGHGARPHLSRDPIEACASWVQMALRRVGRAVDPHQTVVISIGQMNAGHSPNVIPDTSFLAGSLRSLDQESRRVALETLADVSAAVEKESGCTVEMRLAVSAPAVVNDPRLNTLLKEAALETIGAGAVDRIPQPSMGSEDFSFYLDHIPGAMMRLGVAGPQVGQAPLHTSRFDIDEQSISTGVRIFAAAVIRYFNPVCISNATDPNQVA